MGIEDWVDENDIRVQLESADLTIFRRAYETLQERVKFAEEGFKNTSIYPCLKGALDKYTPRYESLLI
jgi:hypothetical protein